MPAGPLLAVAPVVVAAVAAVAAVGLSSAAGGPPHEPVVPGPAAPVAGVGGGDAGGRPARLTWPLRPRPVVLRRFVVGPQPWSPGHRGVDLAAAAGAPVLAAGPGRVSFAGSVAGVGVVVVDHGPLRTTYQPVVASVRPGAAVGAGTPLGVLAGPSHCPGPCLHWGALRGEVYLDPLLLVAGAGPAVLLPLGPSG